MVTPLAKSTPVTQSSQTPIVPPGKLPPVKDILEHASNEQARVDYIERQMQHMGSIPKPPLDMSSYESAPQSQDVTYRPQSREATPVVGHDRVKCQQQTGTVTHDNLQKQVQEYCQENRVKGKQEWESHRIALDRLRKHKEQQKQQQSPEEWDAAYVHMLQDFEQT